MTVGAPTRQRSCPAAILPGLGDRDARGRTPGRMFGTLECASKGGAVAADAVAATAFTSPVGQRRSHS
ncbi:hypothetical protein [Kitasatospora sp. NPDC056184]|uniref:hypothetical protein n=1 Tax=Kitasatospora sp. NPDC056184 TaxID=3345738 RepID=UPI0035E005C4